MSQIDLYNRKKTQLLENISQAAAVFNDLKMSSELSVCEDLYEKLSKDSFKVVIMGQFKVGKSTFINALLGGGDILPAKATPCTAVINEVKYSEEKYAVIHFKHPIPSPLPKLADNVKAYIEKYRGNQVPPIKIPVEHLNKFVVIDDEAEDPDQKMGIAQTPFSKAEIYWNLPICEKGVEIIDTPGLNENESRTKVTMSYLSNADAIIFVMDCQSPCGIIEMEAIDAYILGGGHEYTMFVGNKINLIKERDREEAKRYITKRLSDKTKLGEKGIYFINAEAAKDGKYEGDSFKVNQSGMSEFEKALDDYLANKRGTIKLLQPVSQLEVALERAIASVIPTEKKMLGTSIQEIEKRLQKELPNLERLKREKEILTASLENYISKICVDTDRILENRYDELISDIPKIVNEIEISEVNHVKWNPFKVKESINSFSKELIEKLQNRIETSQKRWQSEKFEPFLENQLKEMADKYQAALAQIFIDIEKIKLRVSGADDIETPSMTERAIALVAGFFGAGFGGAAAGGALGFSSDFIRTLATQIAVGFVLGLIFGATNPITIIGVLVAGFLGLGHGLTRIEEKIRTKVSEQVVAQIRSERGDSVKNAVALLRKKLADGTVSIASSIDKELQSVENLINQIKADKQMGEQKVQARMLKLDEENKTLRCLLASLNVLRKGLDAGDVEFTPMSEDQKIPEFSFEQYEEPKPDKPIFSYDLPAPSKLDLPVAPAREEPHFVIPPDQEVFEKDGVVYHKLDKYIHGDNECNGHLYVGDNAEMVCGKCGEIKHANYWKQESKENGDAFKVLNCTNSIQDINTAIVGSVVSKAGLEWFGRCLSAMRSMSF